MKEEKKKKKKRNKKRYKKKNGEKGGNNYQIEKHKNAELRRQITCYSTNTVDEQFEILIIIVIFRFVKKKKGEKNNSDYL